MNLKIRDKIIGVMVLLIVLPIALLGWRAYSLSSNALREQYEEMGEVISQEVNLLIRDRIGETNKLVNDLSLDPNLLSIENEDNLNYARAQFTITKESYGFPAVFFGSTNGKMYSSLGEENIDLDVRERDWYTKAIQTEDVVWSEVYENASTGENTITVSKAVYDGSQLKGVVAIDMNLAEFSSVVTEVEVMGGHPIVMDKDGIILVEKDPAWIGQRFEAKDQFGQLLPPKEDGSL